MQSKKRNITLSLADIEAQEASFKNFQDTKAWLEETFPDAFNFKKPKPLKIGIQQELLLVSIPCSKRQLNKFLRVYTNSKVYLEVIVQENWRYGLNGERVEEVTQTQKDHALRRLEAKKVHWEKNKKTKFFR